MNSYIDNCIEIVADPCVPSAVMSTVYSCGQNNSGYTNFACMQIATKSVQDCNKYTKDLANDLIKCLKFLEGSQYHLHKLTSVCIVDSELPQALLVVNNTNCVSAQLVRYVLCITYDKHLFSSYLQQFCSVLSSSRVQKRLPLELTSRCVTRTDVFNVMTFMNCVAFTFLRDACRDNAFEEWQARPFWKTFKMFTKSFGNGALGLLLSNTEPHTSNVMFNLIMCYINYRIFIRNRSVILANLFANDAPQ